MKKVLFCAAMVAAMSMAFVACGKKDNKNAEGEENQPKKECCDKAAMLEKFVSDFEAAVAAEDYDKAYQISKEVEQKINPQDFSQEQVERILKAGALIPEEIQAKYE